jgi:hypothetical protein
MRFRILLATAGLLFTTSATAAPSTSVVNRTENALFEQMRCNDTPKVARAINTMLRNKLVRYKANESGVYMFVPSVPLKFLGLPIKHISGFDLDTAFKGVPDSVMVGTAPPAFLEIDIAAPTSELKKRALDAGLVEAVAPSNRGFQVSAKGWASYLASKSHNVMSSIRCAA